MKKILLLSTLLVASTFSVSTYAQGDKTPKSPRVTAQGDWGTVSYGQPSKNGRVIFGDLVPYGKVWRTGANMSTDLTVTKDVIIGGKELKTGTYSIFTIPRENEWVVIINSKPGQMGASEYEANKSNNVVEVTVPTEKNDAVVEQFTISFVNTNLVFNWDEVRVTVPVEVK